MSLFIDDLFDQFEKIIPYQEQFHSSKITRLKIDCRTIEFKHLFLGARPMLSKNIHLSFIENIRSEMILHIPVDCDFIRCIDKSKMSR